VVEEQPAVGVITVNYNTATHVSQLVFSLARVLGGGEFACHIVVDNGSNDDSLHLLGALQEAGLVTLVTNRARPYHGPGLNRGVSWLAQHQSDSRFRVDYVCLLDSDVIALRPGALPAGVAALRKSGGVFAGQFRDGAHANIHAALFDPRMAWRRPIPPFQEHPLPGLRMQRVLRRRGMGLVDFPFCRDEYFLHLGHSTVREVNEDRHRGHRYHKTLDPTPHYEGNPRGEERYLLFNEAFMDEVPTRDGEALVEACLRPGRLRFA
jgi:glycosyltransferase involved in cell wall biosynthesis